MAFVVLRQSFQCFSRLGILGPRQNSDHIRSKATVICNQWIVRSCSLSSLRHRSIYEEYDRNGKKKQLYLYNPVSKQYFCTSATRDFKSSLQLFLLPKEVIPDDTPPNDVKPTEPSPGLFKRFKDAYQEYGKLMIGVHVVTSVVWFSAFYYAALSGVEMEPILEWLGRLGAPESILKKFTETGLGNLAVAYLMYEIAKPPRYFVTLVGTRFAAKLLRKQGIMKPAAKAEDSIRNLVKEGRTLTKTKIDEKKVVMKERMDDRKGKIKDGIESKKEQIKHRMEDEKDRMKSKLGEKKEQMKDRTSKLKDKIDDKKEMFMKKPPSND